ncbi:uncharacterized protein LOC111006514 isoform X2 [Momordica charantia]|uniref:Uncharacterized protein LOC111006514 isoform X2 n=1 Tax=Momordica charantia TaxID=3673 RepID=A0A6J1BXH3_MOMCH|nr:uncharacterized protein LOC111006514 isoform X2 [Momordica charantia]
MAPRVRSRKRGNLRIDAALDAMAPFGFSPKLVRDTVKELLSVYGGDDGWVFIEEGSYTLLIDTILDKLKDGVHEENERAEIHEETSIAGCSSNPRDELTVKEIDDVLISPYEDNEAFRITTPLSTIDSEGRYRIDDAGPGDDDHFRSPPNQSAPAAHTPKISRRPYHGWISSNDKKEDLVHLPPDPEFARLLMTPTQRKRKQRWDVKPAES